MTTQIQIHNESMTYIESGIATSVATNSIVRLSLYGKTSEQELARVSGGKAVLLELVAGVQTFDVWGDDWRLLVIAC